VLRTRYPLAPAWGQAESSAGGGVTIHGWRRTRWGHQLMTKALSATLQFKASM
jgi:hypothetical protein